MDVEGPDKVPTAGPPYRPEAPGVLLRRLVEAAERGNRLLEEIRDHLLPPRAAVVDRSIKSMHFSARVRNSLTRAGVTTLGQLVKLSAEELLAWQAFGDGSLRELRDRLRDFGLTLRDDPTP